MVRSKGRIRWFVLSFLLSVSCCTPLIGPYSPTAYQYATSLKAETLALMDKADNSYNSQKEKVEALVVELRKAHEYVKGVPSNSISAQQWDILIREDGDLLGKFFTRWRERGELSKILIIEFKQIISDAFDEIICLEANKKEPSRCGSLKEG
jgi:hypothetical protein